MNETRVEYAVRYEDGVQSAATYSGRLVAQHVAEVNADVLGVPTSVVRRTVTYGEWEPVR